MEQESHVIRNSDKVFVRTGELEETLDYKELVERLGVEAFVRIPESEFDDIEKEATHFGHFNMESSGHKPGSKYALVKILKHGSYPDDTKDERPPLLTLDGGYVVECVEAENHIPYDKLTSHHFEHPMKSIPDVSALKDAIVRRYSVSRGSTLSREGIIDKGVGFTLFKILGKINYSREENQS